MKKVSNVIKAICVIVGIFCTLHSIMPPMSQTASATESDNQIKGVWAATVFSLDYPSKQTTSAASLRKDIDNLLNNVQKMGYNHLFFQVRPSGDALYDSEIYPWSKYLTGQYDVAPSGNFDPLAYMTEAAHRRNISVHAWVNPYRLTASASEGDKLPETAISNKYPHLAVKHTDGKLYLNPGEPEANQLIIDGITEIVKNYDVDGIHIDDYFYPDSSFPDSETFTKYGGDFSDIGDWRRNNVTNLIKGINEAVKKENPNMIFSVSPCGIWANKNSHPQGSNTTGAQAYFDYYADTRLWVKEEIIDWIMPQIYWNIGYEAADFETVAEWWNNTVEGTSVTLCIGQGIYKATEETNPQGSWYGENGVRELEAQVELIENLDNGAGYGHYRLGSITAKDYLIDFATKVNLGNQEDGGQLPEDVDQFPWAEDAVRTLYEKGVFEGVDGKNFNGDKPVTRGDFIFMLVRLMGKDANVTENFDDVSEDKYYYKEIGIAKILGITTGRDEKTFDPEGKVTRQEMATMIYRVLERENALDFNKKFSLSAKFSDAHKIGDFARTPVAAMADMKLLVGNDSGEFMPLGNATRAEAAVFLCRVAELF